MTFYDDIIRLKNTDYAAAFERVTPSQIANILAKTELQPQDFLALLSPKAIPSLEDMAQAAHLNESAVLAEMLQEELLGGSEEEKNRGIKQAPLRVLMGATMPAVLVEVGFITNPEEERLLRSTDFKNQLAQAIFRGVLKYKKRFERMSGMNSSLLRQEVR